MAKFVREGDEIVLDSERSPCYDKKMLIDTPSELILFILGFAAPEGSIDSQRQSRVAAESLPPNSTSHGATASQMVGDVRVAEARLHSCTSILSTSEASSAL